MKKIKLNVLNANHELVRSYTTEFNEKEGEIFELEVINHKYSIDLNGLIKSYEIKED